MNTFIVGILESPAGTVCSSANEEKWKNWKAKPKLNLENLIYLIHALFCPEKSSQSVLHRTC